MDRLIDQRWEGTGWVGMEFIFLIGRVQRIRICASFGVTYHRQDRALGSFEGSFMK